MGGQTTSQYGQTTQREEPSAWAVGLVTFAGIMMIMIGAFQAFTGLVALFQNQFYLSTPNYLITVDTTTWGWIHMTLGVLVLLAGIALLAGQTWARIVGVVLAALSAFANFTFIPYSPIWSLTIIALDTFVIWALVSHGNVFEGAD
jgi:vacuolar-type H+-ATPase subunit I/STV1